MRPTAFCPNKTTRICMVLPEGENGTTDDSYFSIPGTCPLHTGAATIITEPSSEQGSEGVVTPIGPGYQSPTTSPTQAVGPGVP